MDIFLNSLSPDLICTKYKKIGDTIHIYCENKSDGKICHDKYVRTIKDVSYGSYKTIIHLTSKRYKTEDGGITRRETFSFLNDTGRRTQRLDDAINKVCKENSANSSARIIKEQYGFVSHDTLNRMIKKNK